MDLFHRDYFARSIGAACAVVLAHHKQAATRRAGKRTRPPVGRLGLPAGVAALARWTRIALRVAPTREADAPP